VPRAGEKVSIYTLPLHFKKVLKGSHGGSVAPDIEIPRLINLIQANKMTLNGLVTHTFPLDKVNDAIAMHRSGAAARVMLQMRAK
jgi:S-(hydroxymethyl)glutathione dehydrogenase/alcohol dehydrogenase